MRRFNFAVMFCACLLGACVLCPGQLTPEEAQQRLEERVAQAKAQAALPSNLTNGEVDALRKQIAQQQAQIELLKKQLAEAQGKLTSAATTRPAYTPKQVFTEVAVGMTLADVKSIKESKLTMTSGNTQSAHYALRFGLVNDFQMQTVVDFPGNSAHGPVTHQVQQQVGQHFTRGQDFDLDVATQKVVSVVEIDKYTLQQGR